MNAQTDNHHRGVDPSAAATGTLSRRAALGRLAGAGLAAAWLAGLGSARARAQATPTPRAATGQVPNSFSLEGAGTRIRYSTTSFAGPPTLDYRGPLGERTFLGDAIRVEDSAPLGRLVSVLLDADPDARVVWLTLLLPAFNPVQTGDAPIPFATVAVLTTHLTTVGGPRFIEGALQTYQVVELAGTADFLVF